MPKETEEPIKEEFVKKEDFDEAVNKIVHASRARDKAEFRKIQEGLEAKIAEMKAMEAPAPEAKVEPTAEMKAYEARLKAYETELKVEKLARETEKQKREHDEERNSLSAALADKGITGAKLKAALALLHTEEKRVARNKDGAVVFRIAKDGYEDEVNVIQGVEAWTATPEGKEFLPPRGASGSGADRANRKDGSPRKGGKPTDGEVAEAIMDMMVGR